MLETGSGNALVADGLLSAARAVMAEPTGSFSECGLAAAPECEVVVSARAANASAFRIYPHADAEVMAQQD
ncbi:hypothetical protein [Paraburkholderia unamae]|uniref:hypothetical protein n=1 Tax=Paraburkholderia unamae TaxID=219649 RepID=UPI0010578280|nr:hypothetical protein [Paraburkholderia unamae]